MHEPTSNHPGDHPGDHPNDHRDPAGAARTPPVNDRGRAYDPGAPGDERTYAVFMHLSLLAHLLMSFMAVFIPVIMWGVKKEGSPFIDDHGREAINFQITLVIYSFLFAILAIPVGILTCGVGFAIVFVPFVLGLVGMVQASMAANRGEFYRYPMTLRFLG